MKRRPNYAYVNFYQRPATLVAFDIHDEVFKQLPCWQPFLAEVTCDARFIDCVSTAVYNNKCQNRVMMATVCNLVSGMVTS